MIAPEQLGMAHDRHAPALLLYARQLADAASAEDLVQEAFVKLACQWRAPRNVRAWLFRTVHNAAVTGHRRRQSRQAHLERLRQRQPAWFESRLDDRLDAQAAQAALERLDRESRQVVVLRIWGELGFRDIARIQRVSVAAVHRRYGKALEQLRSELEISCIIEK